MDSNAPTPRPLLGVVSDETGPSLDGCIALATEEGLDQIEIRMVDGVAPLSLTEAQARNAHERIKAAGLTVSGIATPLLKWEMPGRTPEDQGDQFGFAREGRSDVALTDAAVRLADIFETQNLRIFSYLKHANFELYDLKPTVEYLINEAEKHDKYLMLENEPVCNIARFEQLVEAMEFFNSPRLLPLPDIGNSASIGEFPSVDCVTRVVRCARHIHFKDFSKAAGKFVPLGIGDVQLTDYMAEISVASKGRQLSFSIETHIHDDPLGGTRASARELRRQTEKYWKSG